MKVAIIPARGGSKRIPKKNSRVFYGKPMIAWSIEKAKNSNIFDMILVSTDDENIKDIAIHFGAQVPFIRDTSLSDDLTPTVPVIADAIKYLIAHGFDIKSACCIYATAPFIDENDIIKAYKILSDSKCDYVFPITKFSYPIQRGLRFDKQNQSIEMVNPHFYNFRSQDLEEVYHDVGQFYWGLRDAWLTNKPVFGTNSKSIVIPDFRVQDIDNEDDWKQAELMFKALNQDA
jgi:N-acylneuraminate cytidylyltransferase